MESRSVRSEWIEMHYATSAVKRRRVSRSMRSEWIEMSHSTSATPVPNVSLRAERVD